MRFLLTENLKHVYILFCNSVILKPSINFSRTNIEDVKGDAEYLINKYFFHESQIDMTGGIARNSLRLQKQIILKLFDYSSSSPSAGQLKKT